jgi:1,4-dihydroxy-2-naphthoate octaprenyltransferase
MRTRTTTPVPAVRLGDVVIALLLLALFVFAYVQAQDWPFRTRFFPELLATAGIVFAVIKLLGFGLQAHQHRQRVRQLAIDPVVTDEVEPGTDERGDEHSIEYVFGTAGGRAWLAALAWVAAFFVSLCVLGVFITVPLFALAYLKIAGSAGWLSAATYAAVAGGVLWFVFGELLAVPMPAGIF